MSEDAELLRQYAQSGSETAFAELVRHYLPLVYAAALRQGNGDEALAKDVAQTVFINLARKASSLLGRELLAGWLYTSTRLAASMAVRGDRRRQLREQIAASMQQRTTPPESQPEQNELRLVLDEAMSELDAGERNAVLIRFFQGKELKEVGSALGISEDAARMRITRALANLQTLLKQRGVTITTVALGTALATEAAAAVPAGMAAGISATALASAATAGSTLAATKAIAMTTLQKTLITATLVASVGTGIYEAHQASVLRGQVHTLRKAQGPSSEGAEQSTRDHEDAARQLAALRDENERLNRNATELLRLRGEVARLRGAANNPGDSSANSWLARVNELKRRLEQTPGAKIPELQFLTEENWLDAAKGEFKTDEDYRKALATLRMEGTTKFALMLSGALTKYAQANNGHFPTDLIQLQPYLNPDADSSILQRYQIIPRIYLSNGAPVNGPPAGEWAITQKAPVDEEKDVRISIGLDGVIERSYRTEMDRALDSAISAFAAANNGRMPQGIYDLQPFITSPAERAAFQKRITSNAASRPPVSVPGVR